MFEGDYFEVDLNSTEGKKEIIDYLFEFVQRAQAGFGLSTPDGKIVSGDQQRSFIGTQRTSITDANIKKVISESIIDPYNFNLSLELGQLLSTIILSVESEEDKPVSQIIRGLENVAVPETEFAQSMYAELLAFQGRELLRTSLEKKSSQTKHVRIIGGLAAGKTTFLKNIHRNLQLDQANIDVHSVEPEDSEIFYPGLEVVNHYRFQRGLTRGKEATMGSERLQLFAQLPRTNEIIDIKIHSAGGHAQAEIPRDPIGGEDFDAVAFFIDYRLMEEISQSNFSRKDDNDVLGNGETVIQTVRSLLARIQELKENRTSRIGVITKLPKGNLPSKEVIRIINTAYTKVLRYAVENKEDVIDTFETGDIEITIPPYIDIEQDIDDWLPIHSDGPRYSGTIEVIQALVSHACTYDDERPKVLLVNFEEESHDNNLIHSSKIIDTH